MDYHDSAQSARSIGCAASRRAPGGTRIVDWAAQAPPPPDAALEVSIVEDDRLRLIFTCCHPALDPAAQVALTLRLLGGLETTEIARAFLVSDATMSQRIVRGEAENPRCADTVSGAAS